MGGCKIASLAGPGPGRERLAEVAVVGVLGRDRQALPVGEPLGERAVPGGQVLDPLAHLGGLLARGQGELVALGVGGGLGFGRTQRREVLAGVAAAQFGVGGDGQVPLGAGGVLPVGAVGHDGGEHGLALPVGLAAGPGSWRPACASGWLGRWSPRCCGGAGVGGGAQAGQAGVPGGGADLAQLVARRTGGAQAVSTG